MQTTAVTRQNGIRRFHTGLMRLLPEDAATAAPGLPAAADVIAAPEAAGAPEAREAAEPFGANDWPAALPVPAGPIPALPEPPGRCLDAPSVVFGLSPSPRWLIGSLQVKITAQTVPIVILTLPNVLNQGIITLFRLSLC